MLRTVSKDQATLGKARYALVQEIAGAPMEMCGVDLSGPWPLSKQGNQYLCVVQDYYTRYDGSECS